LHQNLVLPNGPEMAVASLGVAVDAICTPLNPSYGTQDFDGYLAELHAKTLIVQAGIDSPVRTVARARDISVIELSPAHEADAGCFTLSGEERWCPQPHQFAQPTAVAFVLHTSGTASRPKLVPLTHANVCGRAYHKCIAHYLVETDRCLNIMPLWYGHGLIHTLLASLMAGASVVCTPGFDATQFFAWLEEFHPTWYTAAPPIHQEILEHASRHREVIARCPLRFVRSGTAPLPPQVLAELERVLSAPVTETYGLTETSTIAYNPLPPFKRKAGSVGVPLGLEVAIMDLGGTLLPRGAMGEIVVRGATVTQGYDNDPTANRSAFTQGWFRTGDQGYLDTDGYLFITGRLKEIINRGGEKISPHEIEEVLMEHPAVAESVAFAMPHPRLGEDLAVAIVLRENASATVMEVREFASSRLADFKVPRHVVFVDEIPKGPTGKAQRIGLAGKLGLAEHGQSQSTMRAGHTAPRTLIEAKLAAIWAQVLRLDTVGVHDNFFELGGHSLLATQVLSRLREAFQLELPLRRLAEAPTVAELAKYIETVRWASHSLQPPPKDTVGDCEEGEV
jgi:acyl-CoA synthetase (AMP-forming)/AMP-acid ligase II/acyl carrier protein